VVVANEKCGCGDRKIVDVEKRKGLNENIQM
jgi:hypothetical protein